MKTISEEYILQLSRLHDQKASFGDAKGLKPVSYTHLTLPTNTEV